MILHGDCLEQMRTLDANSIQTCVTSPPYWGLRDYGVEGQLGLEKTPEEYVAKMVEVFREVKRVLKDDGTLWLNLGDSYAGSGKGRNADGTHGSGGSDKQHTNTGAVIGRLDKSVTPNLKPKDLVGIPWRVAFALQADGWYLRQDIIWHKPNPMPESVTDRCTKSHEYIFLMSKSPKYYFDHEAIKEPAVSAGRIPGNKVDQKLDSSRNDKVGIFAAQQKPIADLRNRRSVWTVTTKPFKGAHFATFPIDLIEPCILAGSAKGDTVLDPFFGAGTTGVAALNHERKFIGCELNQEYVEIAEKRIEAVV